MDSLFLGSHKVRRTVNLGNQPHRSHHDLVQQARLEREQRTADRIRTTAATTLQAFYRGRSAAGHTRNEFRSQFDALVPTRATDAGSTPSAHDFVFATRLLVAAGSFRPGTLQDIKRLAAWCRTALRPPSPNPRDPDPAATAGKRKPVPLLFAPFGTGDAQSWAALVRMVAALLLTEATTSISLPQAPLFLEIVKILADPTSYPKYGVPAATAAPTALLVDLLQRGQLYSRLGHALATVPVQDRVHPCLSPLISLSLLPLRSFTSQSDPAPRATALASFAASILTVPLLCAPGRLGPTQAASFATADFPLWEVLAALNESASAPIGSERQSVALLTNVVELAKGRLAVAGTTGKAGGVAGAGGQVENGKQLVAYLDVLRRVLGDLSRRVVFAAAGPAPPSGGDQAQAKAKEQVETIVIDSDSEDDDELLSEGGAGAGPTLVRSVRRPRDSDGDEDMADEPALSVPPPLRLDPRERTSLAYLWSREHLLALLALSTRFSASTRPALCGLLVALLAPTDPPSPTRDAILNTLLYSPSSSGLLRELFRGYIRSSELGRTLAGATRRERSVTVLAALRDGNRFRDEWPVLVLAIEMYARSLLTMGDDEFHAAAGGAGGAGAGGGGGGTGRNPLSLDEVVTLSAMVRNATFALYWQDESATAANSVSSTAASTGQADGAGVMVDPVANATQRQVVVGTGGWSVKDVRGLMTKFLQQVHARDSRRHFTPEGHWHMTSAFDLRSFVESAVYEDERLEAEAGAEDEAAEAPPAQAAPARAPNPFPLRRGLARNTNDSRGSASAPSATSTYSKRQLALISPRLGILRNIPFVVPFETRVAIFRQFVANDFRKLGLGGATSFMARARHRAVVRRTHLAEDAYTHLNGLGPELKKRIEIVFIDEHGMEESGIDGGGLFKELLTSLSKEVFDTNRGLWLSTSEQELYPNPHGYARESNQLSWFKFIGRILGKALYEGILVNVKFADFFLAKWLGRQSYLDDLASLDPELYSGLLKLKTYPGNVEEDLSLNFTITEEDFGVSRSIDLIPRGSEIPVTNDNRMQYIVLVSNYRLNVQIAQQCRAFYSGLFEMINPRWLRMFNQSELAVLVGGTEEAIDIDDLRRNTVYSGWAAEDNTPTVQYFWEAVASFSKEERAKLVKFVTACERPPLLGFAQLNPLFAIRNAGQDESRLPTSATCVNLLKLPEYKEPGKLREKLLYAINSGAGFDLS